MSKIAPKAAEPSSISHIMAEKENILITEQQGWRYFCFEKEAQAETAGNGSKNDGNWSESAENGSNITLKGPTMTGNGPGMTRNG